MSIKKFYSVKETAKILGVSTNTVYKYVDMGSLLVRRLGRGRIKIPYTSLSQIADLGEPELMSLPYVKQVNSEVAKEAHSPSDVIIFGVNDIVFFRIFRGLVLFGLGIIYLFDNSSLFSFAQAIKSPTTQFLISITPFVLIFAGLISMLYDFRQKSPASARLLVHVFNCLVFTFYVITSFLAGRYGQIVFIMPLGILAATHIMRGIHGTSKSNFYDEFLRYVLLTALFGGGLITAMPDFFPIPVITNFISQNKNIFAFAWFFCFVPPLVYFLSPYGRNSKGLPFFFAIWSAVSLVIATQITTAAKWDIAYMSYLVAAFGIFLVTWSYLNLQIEVKKLFIFLYFFGWVGLTLILGLFSIKSSQNQLIRDTKLDAQNFLGQTERQVNAIFTSQRQIMITQAGTSRLIEAITSENAQEAIDIAKLIFEQSSYANQTIIYNSEGKGIGIYPVNTLAQGADYSSRDYFLVTKATYSGYTTPVFENILGTATVLQSEPVFENNKFIGLIGTAISVDNFYKFFNLNIPNDSQLYFVDENGILVYSRDGVNIGRKFDTTLIDDSFGTPEKIVIGEAIVNPRWKVYEVIPLLPIFSKITNLNINLTILFVFNLLISLAFSFLASSSKTIRYQAGKMGILFEH